MGNEAVTSPNEDPTLDENQEVDPEAAEQVDDKSADADDEGQPEPDGQEVEIVRAGDDGSQPKDKTAGIRKRVNKLNAKVRAAEDTSSQAVAELATLREQNKVLQLFVEQTKAAESTKPPDPNDFDDGVHDPKYVEAHQKHTQEVIAAEVQKQAAAFAPVQTDTSSVSRELERRQTRHYEQADKLGAVDYQETEDKAVAILGNETVNQLISKMDSSPLILYFLGKNPDEAEEIKALIDTDPVKAVLKLGELGAGLKVQPKAKSDPTPDPDDELRGGSPAATGALAKKFEKAIALAQQGGEKSQKGLKQMAALRKEAKAKGITLER